jgi:hypothetical protein
MLLNCPTVNPSGATSAKLILLADLMPDFTVMPSLSSCKLLIEGFIKTNPHKPHSNQNPAIPYFTPGSFVVATKKQTAANTNPAAAMTMKRVLLTGKVCGNGIMWGLSIGLNADVKRNLNLILRHLLKAQNTKIRMNGTMHMAQLLFTKVYRALTLQQPVLPIPNTFHGSKRVVFMSTNSLHTILGATLLLNTAALPAMAASVSIRVHQPGVYGRITLGEPEPQVAWLAPQPVVVTPPPVVIAREPIYLYIPTAHSHNWARHCYRYSACSQPVIFVRGSWVRERHAAYYRDRDRDGDGDGVRDGRDRRPNSPYVR